jgi:uncharacterized protein YndB with AHSA1/START domain
MATNATHQRIVGQTKDAGFQIGARKTFPISPEQAWDLVTSDEGLKAWLGEVEHFRLEKGQKYQTREGAEGEVRVVEPGGHVRLTWRPKGWSRASLIQVRVIPGGSKTVISFHQEHLRGDQERAQMARRWQAALDRFQALLGLQEAKD